MRRLDKTVNIQRWAYNADRSLKIYGIDEDRPEHDPGRSASGGSPLVDPS
jgi:hypothetical protein